MAYTVINGKLVKVQRNQWTGATNVPAILRNNAEKAASVKGAYLGLCNRSACLAPGANWYNRGSYAFYCENCAHMLNHANRHDEFCKEKPLCCEVASEEDAASRYHMRKPK